MRDPFSLCCGDYAGLPWYVYVRGDVVTTYDSLLVHLQSDNEYTATLWLRGNDSLQARGEYVKAGNLYAFDPATAKVAFGVASADSLTVLANSFGFDRDYFPFWPGVDLKFLIEEE